MNYVAGVDVGSTQTKAIVIDRDRTIVGRALLDMETSMVGVAQQAYRAALADAQVAEEQVLYVAGTGYGRYKVTFGQEQVTEISCHARGAIALFPGTRTVIDIGGQDTKAISVKPDGQVGDFTMNDKCAAGTGRFLGAASYALEMPLSELGPLALKSENPVRITTTCTVFAESEIISHLAKGLLPEDVLMGVHQAITNRCVSLARRVGIESEVTFTGGVSRNAAIVKLLEEAVGMKINVSSDAHFCGALGAALFAHDRAFGSGTGPSAIAA
ncbi:MAG: 2-hydroxyglutaryl-CoA dehydratase [Proteobacteria bacterium]|jgi:predicted CoA-substrate-specific enzyme activase|nr:2-hydroxyglutaryl-CoA dehydratase [Pseudomonadota bacterium]